MNMVTDHVDVVIGIDTHKHTHTAAFVDRLGGIQDTLEIEANASGYRRLLRAASEHEGVRVWAVEGTGSYGAGLTTALVAAGEHVVEVERPSRPMRRAGAKSDPIDALRAAREVLAREHQIEPRQRGNREAVRVLSATRSGAVVARTKALNHLHALVVTAPEELRRRLAARSTGELARRCVALRVRTDMTDEHRATVMALRACARRAVACGREADELEPSSNGCCASVFPSCSTSPVSDRSARPRSTARGPTTGVSVTTPRSLRSPESHPCPRRPARLSVTASTAAVTANSTERCTPSCSHDSCATPRPRLTQSDDAPRAKHPATSDVA